MNTRAASLPPLMSKVKMEPAPFGKYFSYRAWSGRPLDGRVGDGLDFRHGLQVLDDLQRVLNVALDAQDRVSVPLQQQEGSERRQGGAGVAQQNGADAGHKGGSAEGLVEVQAVIGGIRLGQSRELARNGVPVELAAFDDHTAEGGAVAADELGGGLDHDVSAVLQRAEQVRGGEGVVHNHRQVVLVGDFGDGFEVRQVGVRVAEGLEVDELWYSPGWRPRTPCGFSAETKVVVMPSRGRVWRSRLKVPP